MPAPAPITPFPEVNAVLHGFLTHTRTILGDGLRGMYLSGSLALGDFSPHRSDIDFIVVTDADPDDTALAALQAMHAHFNASDSPWATEVEAAYIPLANLRRYDPAHAWHSHIERGAGRMLQREHLDSDWIIHRSVIREHGIVITGPDPHTLIDPVSAHDLRGSVITLMRHWWGPMRADASLLELNSVGYQPYAVLTMCRILYTLDRGDVVSKPVAAQWAQETLGTPWNGLIARALVWQKSDTEPPSVNTVQETQALITYTLARCERFPLETIATPEN